MSRYEEVWELVTDYSHSREHGPEWFNTVTKTKLEAELRRLCEIEDAAEKALPALDRAMRSRVGDVVYEGFLVHRTPESAMGRLDAIRRALERPT